MAGLTRASAPSAGFFLFAVQPFKLGDRVAVTYATPLSAGGAQPSSWFEGTCETVDLRCAAGLVQGSEESPSYCRGTYGTGEL